MEVLDSNTRNGQGIQSRVQGDQHRIGLDRPAVAGEVHEDQVLRGRPGQPGAQPGMNIAVSGQAIGGLVVAEQQDVFLGEATVRGQQGVAHELGIADAEGQLAQAFVIVVDADEDGPFVTVRVHCHALDSPMDTSSRPKAR